jgi:hypothetical protein
MHKRNASCQRCPTKCQENQRAPQYKTTLEMDEQWHHGEEFNCLPSPCSNAEFSLHVSQNSSRYKLVKDITWEASCTEIELTLPNALDTNRPTKSMAERSASSYERSHVSEGKRMHKGIVTLPSSCTISTRGTLTPDKTRPTIDN